MPSNTHTAPRSFGRSRNDHGNANDAPAHNTTVSGSCQGRRSDAVTADLPPCTAVRATTTTTTAAGPASGRGSYAAKPPVPYPRFLSLILARAQDVTESYGRSPIESSAAPAPAATPATTTPPAANGEHSDNAEPPAPFPYPEFLSLILARSPWAARQRASADAVGAEPSPEEPHPQQASQTAESASAEHEAERADTTPAVAAAGPMRAVPAGHAHHAVAGRTPALSPEDKVFIRRHTAQRVLQLVMNDLEHIRRPGSRQIEREGDGRDICDICQMTMPGGFWICGTCDAEICLLCKEEPHGLRACCGKRSKSERADDIPVFSRDPRALEAEAVEAVSALYATGAVEHDPTVRALVSRAEAFGLI